MRDPMLLYTTVPILLGGIPREAGRLAAELYTAHGVDVHWFGRGRHLLLSIYAKRSPLNLTFAEENDGAWLRLLRDFEKQQRHIGGISCLIPCSEAAEGFLNRMREALEDRFVLLPRPTAGEDPLYGLVHGH